MHTNCCVLIQISTEIGTLNFWSAIICLCKGAWNSLYLLKDWTITEDYFHYLHSAIWNSGHTYFFGCDCWYIFVNQSIGWSTYLVQCTFFNDYIKDYIRVLTWWPEMTVLTRRSLLDGFNPEIFSFCRDPLLELLLPWSWSKQSS